MSTKLPEYVRLHQSALYLDGDRYRRSYGGWSIGYKFMDGQLVSSAICDNTRHIDEVPFIEITEDEHSQDNTRYGGRVNYRT